MVSQLNTVLGQIKVQTRYDAETRTSGVLAGNSTIRRLADTLRDGLDFDVVTTYIRVGGGAFSRAIRVEADRASTVSRRSS